MIQNPKTGKSKSIQVKGSRTYLPPKSFSKKFGDGQTSWNWVNETSIFSPTNKIDFFIYNKRRFPQDFNSKNDTKIRGKYSIFN